ncbi:MAG TPA: START domain-containing protein [Moraxellaceae bacterium]
MRGWLAAALLVLGTQAVAAADWQLARHDRERDIRIYLRDTPGSSYQNFYAVTRVKTRLSSVVAVLSDVPAMPEWIARVKSARLLRREADRDIWVQSIYKLPYPFLEREAVLHSSLRQEKSGTVEVVTKAEKGFITDNPKKRVRLLNMQSTWRLTPEKDGMVKIEMWGQGDPGGYVPPVLFNYNLPDEPAQTLKHLRQMLTREKYQNKTLGYIREP